MKILRIPPEPPPPSYEIHLTMAEAIAIYHELINLANIPPKLRFLVDMLYSEGFRSGTPPRD